LKESIREREIRRENEKGKVRDRTGKAERERERIDRKRKK
jgi:hypothetical protein